MTKENKTEFVISRVTKTEKIIVKKTAKKAGFKKESDYLRSLLGFK